MAKPMRKDPPAPARYDGVDKMPLNGEWRGGKSSRVAEDRDPYSNALLVSIALANAQDLDEAFSAAAAAQPKWNAMLPGEKAAIRSTRRRADGGMARRDHRLADRQIGQHANQSDRRVAVCARSDAGSRDLIDHKGSQVDLPSTTRPVSF